MSSMNIFRLSNGEKDSYKTNSDKENLLLLYVDNFRQQIESRQLVLDPVNEHGVRKFVSTNIRPVMLPNFDLYYYQGAANFVSDYITYVSLAVNENGGLDPPKVIGSMTKTIETQSGNCFEMCQVLVSILIGVGYDAYIVHGYANDEATTTDLQHLDKDVVVKDDAETDDGETTKTGNRYKLKEEIDLSSVYLKNLDKFNLTSSDTETNSTTESDTKSKTSVSDRVVHAWILVKKGKREVKEDFFIECSNGLEKNLNFEHYLCVIAVWNNQNYWLNQNSDAENSASFDLDNTFNWLPFLVKPREDVRFYMPFSWVRPISFSRDQYDMKYPSGVKEIVHKNIKLEKFALYIEKDGLVERITKYDEEIQSGFAFKREKFQLRIDRLILKEHDGNTNLVIETFKQGRPDGLKEHRYELNDLKPESRRVFTCYTNSRIDELKYLEVKNDEIIQKFSARDDFLSSRHTVFGKAQPRFGPLDETNQISNRPIRKITERYERDKTKNATDDIETITFNIEERKIFIKFHREDFKIICGTREFTKPNVNENGECESLEQEDTKFYMTDPEQTPISFPEVRKLFKKQLLAEKKSIETIRNTEREIVDILNERTKEISRSELEISVFDTKRNEEVKFGRAEQERIRREKEQSEFDMTLDYLAPYLARFPDPSGITKSQALRIRDECLNCLNSTLTYRAEAMSKHLVELQQQLKEKKVVIASKEMLPDLEREAKEFCEKKEFQISVLEKRIKRHKEISNQQYIQLQHKVNNDARITKFLQQ